MASGAPPRSGPPRDAREPAGDGVVWHSTCGYAGCVEPSHYAADSTCKGCRRIKYCTVECQKADWKRHKPECKADAAADEAAAREGALVARPRARAPPPMPELLTFAAARGDVKKIEKLLELGVTPNKAGQLAMTPLHCAAHGGHADIVRALLAAPGVDVNAKTVKSELALHFVTQQGHEEIARLLLAVPGVAVGTPDSEGSTALHYATKLGRSRLALALLAAPGAGASAGAQCKVLGATPLMFASQDCDVAVVRALISTPGVAAGINASDKSSWTPLHYATQKAHLDIVHALLAVPGVSVNAQTNDGGMALHLAAQSKGRAAVVRALLAAGANVNAATPDGTTPLNCAAMFGRDDAARALLAAPRVDVNAVNKSGVTALHAAAQLGHEGVVRLLLAAPGVEVNARVPAVPAGALGEEVRTPQQLHARLGGAPGPMLVMLTALRLARLSGHAGVAALLEAAGGVE